MTSKRSAVVTGAGRGIGRVTAEVLAASGWFVVAVDLNEADLAGLTESNVGNLSTICGDVADRGHLEAAAEMAESQAPIAGWVNNAAYSVVKPLHKTTREEFERVIAVNVGGAFWGSAVAVSHYLASDTPGAIVNVSSIHGSFGFHSWAAYDTSKGAINALTRYAAVEYGQHGIRVNAVAPGTVRTPGHVRLLNETPDPEAAADFLRRQVPLGRIGTEAEVANVIAFLLSDASAYVSGQILGVDGGWSASTMARDAASIEGA